MFSKVEELVINNIDKIETINGNFTSINGEEIESYYN
jgi:hypothetical protein